MNDNVRVLPVQTKSGCRRVQPTSDVQPAKVLEIARYRAPQIETPEQMMARLKSVQDEIAWHLLQAILATKRIYKPTNT